MAKFRFRTARRIINDTLTLPGRITGDSRLMALLAMGGRQISHSGRAGRFIGVILVGFLALYLIPSGAYDLSQRYIIFLTIAAVGLWLTEAIPPFAVGILIIGFLVFSQGGIEGESVNKYVNTWSSPVIWLMLGGFFMAEALRKTGLDQKLFESTLRLTGKGARSILFGLMMATALASMVMSNTATAAMMLASVLPLIKKIGRSHPLSRSLLLGIPAAASLGGMGTIIGSPPNAIAVGALQGVGIEIDFLTWMYFGFPVAMVSVLLMYWLLSRPVNTRLHIDADSLESSPEGKAENDRQAQLITLVITGLTIALWLTNPLHGIPVAVVSGVPIVLLTMFSVLQASDVRALAWDTLMLVAGGLALGLALVDSGLARDLVDQLSFGPNVILTALLFALLTVFLSNIMSNTATASILIPLGLILFAKNVDGMLITASAAALAASCALILPVSTPPNAIAFSTGLLEQKDFRRSGLVAGLLGPLLSVAWLWFLLQWLEI